MESGFNLKLIAITVVQDLILDRFPPFHSLVTSLRHGISTQNAALFRVWNVHSILRDIDLPRQRIAHPRF